VVQPRFAVAPLIAEQHQHFTVLMPVTGASVNSIVRISPARAHVRLSVSHLRPTCRRHNACAAKLIAKSEISPFIPRSDLMDQMYRWAVLEVKNDGVANFGVACDVEFVQREESPWAFIVHMERVRTAGHASLMMHIAG
jgi:hypothetical protein